MGLERFRDFHNAQYEKREGRPPAIMSGDEQAELIYRWVHRQENLRQLARLPKRDRLRLQQIDTRLTRMEECEVAMRGAPLHGGTAWLGFMREVGLRHEELLSQLIRSYHQKTVQNPRARSEFRRAIAELKQDIAREEKAPAIIAESDGMYEASDELHYRQELACFKRNVIAFENITARPLPLNALDALAHYLPNCWWKRLEKSR